ncbi:DpnII family type II restriction endonuclease [Mesomycoplasma moatsii]|uniref:DpnII family type II restriction endonuclease n=1 Tax=Mesomycoplasma moatsii TaxID=171287 RepID=UPI0003B43FFD
MNINRTKLSPFVKWVGGKREVINNYLANYFPDKFRNYFEPFVGGGAVLFYLQPNKANINDLNFELITTYKVIRNNVNELINKLDEYHLNHSKDFFLKLRKEKKKNDVEIAARFIYLNKTGFNGLYRVNKNNEFNVPFSNKTREKLVLYNKENLINLNKYFQNNQINFFNQDFEEILKQTKKGDFVFCDPPYDYEVNVDNGFTSYTQDGFNKEDQIRLANQLKKLNEKGVLWMLTNHNTQLIRNLYQDFYIKPITTNRNINSKGNKRKNTGDEVMITNYEIINEEKKNEKDKLTQYLSSLEKTNIELEDLIDTKKIIKKIDEIEIKLNTLNYIISSNEEEIIKKIKTLYTKNKNVFSVLHTLVASEIDKELKFDKKTIKLIDLTKGVDSIILFFKKTGLLDFIKQNKIKNFVDYLVGVKVGLDTHARKNRFGLKNEKEIEEIIKKEFKKYDFLDIQFQVSKLDIFKSHKKWFNKKFDVVIKNNKNSKTILLESSFYNTQGSKISETSRSYENIFNYLKKYNDQYIFIWIADGKGLESIKNDLSTKIELDYIFNKTNFIDVIKKKLNLK